MERCASRMMVNEVGTLYLQAKAAAIDVMPYRIFHFRIFLPCSDTFYISVYEKWQSTCAYFDLAAGVHMTATVYSPSSPILIYMPSIIDKFIEGSCADEMIFFYAKELGRMFLTPNFLIELVGVELTETVKGVDIALALS
ncbi:hypothetical protein Patl1_29551 [Pistacia atlantica]|uniref:Uncharacterized protein n=1 Tax=Pistacia atlantica TaxID=434234 RepID=A0ACC1ABC7_9ROSI|nr:hypothetical protein Patl1_29551 [Pistacia atlantica]